MENNIITATFDGDNLVYVCPRYQYDYGQILKFTDLDLPFSYEVHYSNSDQTGNSVTQIGDENGVIIPDSLFLTGETIYAWVYLHSTEDDGETVYKVVIPVQKRAKPTNATPTPVQQDAITQAIAALDAGVEAAEAAKQAIEDMGVSSTTLAPGSSATVEKEIDPDTGAITLEFGIPQGQQGEQGEQGEPGQDGYSPTVTVENITGGHRVTVTDAQGQHTFDVMDGEQGEQGEPGQDGTDGFSPVVVVTDITGGHQVAITDAYGTQTFDVMDGEVAFSDLYKAFPHDTASGSLVTIPDGADGIPVRDLVVNIEPLQRGSGDPSPSNIRAISGWTGCKINRTAENIFGGTSLRDGVLAAMASASDDPINKYVSFAATATASKRITDDSGLSYKFKANTQYTFILTIKKSSNDGANLRIYYTDGTNTSITGYSTSKSTIATVSAEGKTIVGLSKTNQGGTTTLYYDESGIFEGVLTAADFKPYVGTTYPVSWEDDAGTVYGGTLDVTTGKLVVDRAIATITSATASNGKTICRYKLGNYHDVLNASKPSYCNILAKDTTSSPPYNSYSLIQSSSYSGDFIYFRLLETAASSNAECLSQTNAILSQWNEDGHPLQVVYELKTPIEYTLTGQQITTLLGLNNIWADCGDVSLDYRADPTLYIQRLTGSAEDDMTANANITSGSYFMVGTNLFVATQAIGQGMAIVPGTNCTALSLADALNALNS